MTSDVVIRPAMRDDLGAVRGLLVEDPGPRAPLRPTGVPAPGDRGRLLAAVTLRYPQASLIRLTVEADNAKGVAFYRRNGFAVTAEVVEDGLRGLRMEKALAGDLAADPA